MKKQITLVVALAMLITIPSGLFSEGQQEPTDQNDTQEKFEFKPYTGTDGLSGKQIRENANNTIIAKDIIAELTMTLINKSGNQRVREMSMKSKEDNGLNKSVMHFTAPADVAGTGFLMVELEDGDSDMWLYLPELKKVRKIVSSSKNDSFMGSDISYSDMEDRSVDDYTYNRFEDETIEGEDCYVLENVPVNDSVVDETGYSKVIYWISKDKMIPFRAIFFDKNGNYFKNMQMKDIKEFSGTWIPTYIEVEDIKKNHKTVMELKNIELGTDPDDSFFTQQYLKRGN